MDNIKYLEKYYQGDINIALNQLKDNQPVQYIVGNVDFLDINLIVNKNVLIPRFETELLVEKTIELSKKYFNNKVDILEIGTGSGCIAISLKKKLDANIVACDISLKALEVARKNASLNKEDITFVHSDIFSNIHGKYDIIISNPPYISDTDSIEDIVKNNEPHQALYASDNGLYFYNQILSESSKYLKDEYLIAFEIGNKQGLSVLKLASSYLPNAESYIEKDLTGNDRYVFIRKSK